MNIACPSCEIPYSPGHLTIPHILPSCSHSICRGCLQLSGLVKCPVTTCQALLPRQDLHLFPVNCHLLGQVMTRQLEREETGFVLGEVGWPPSTASPGNFTVLQDQCKEEIRRDLDSTIAKTRALLPGLQESKRQIEVESSFYEAAVTKLSDHMASCHAELELVKCRMMQMLDQEKEKRILRSLEMSTSEDLIDIIEMPDDVKFDLVIDENILDVLGNHVKIDMQANSIFEGPELPELLSSFVDSKTINCDDGRSEDSSSDLVDIVENELSLLYSLPQAEIVFEELEPVEVIFVETPGSFYVRRLDDWPVAENIRAHLDSQVKTFKQDVVKVLVGQIMAVECRGILTRARVDSIEDEMASVTYIDHGGSGQYPVDQLSQLSGQLSTIHGLAHHCNLEGISPTGSNWSIEAGLALSQATHQTHCLMTVKERNCFNSPLTVALYLQPGEGVAKDHKCCLAEFLVYKEWAVWNHEELWAASEGKYQKGYLKLAPARQGSEYKVIVAHVETPSCVHVQLVGGKGGYAKYISKLIEEVESVYSARSNDAGLKVLVPRVGMACIGMYSDNKKFYRAKVTAVRRAGIVEVQFVDFGNIEEKLDTELWKILDKFLTLPVMATPVSLAEVIPVERIGWDEKATIMLSDMTRCKELAMFIEEEEVVGENHCKVLLYERLPEKDVCINAWLVKEGHAISLTGACTTLEYQKDVMEEMDEEVMNDEVIGRNIPGLCGDRNPEKVACRVINVQSPSSMYVRQVTDEEPFFKMNLDLQAYYSSRPAADVKLSSGSLCAARLGSKEGWARARVISSKGFKVELKLLDAGRIVTLPIQSLRPLANKFRFRNFVEEVHMVNLLPAGGTGRWTRTACEHLCEMLELFEMMVHVEMAGKSLNGTVPVKIYVKQMNGSEAEFLAVDEKLTDAGLAIPAVNRKTSSIDYVKQSKLNNNNPSVKVPDLPKGETSVGSGPTPVTNWLSPDLPSSREFLAMASHVDWECNIFLIPLSPNQDTLRIIGNVLDSKFQGSLPRPVDKYWRLGEAAIARWDLDGKWYRSKVLRVNFDECTVEFVDYGTVEECKIEDMRKDLFMTEIPVQCFPLQLETVQPVGDKWGQSILDFLHSTVVDQTLSVSLASTAKDSEDNSSRVVMGKLTTQAGLEIGQLLIRNDYAKLRE